MSKRKFSDKDNPTTSKRCLVEYPPDVDVEIVDKSGFLNDMTIRCDIISDTHLWAELKQFRNFSITMTRTGDEEPCEITTSFDKRAVGVMHILSNSIQVFDNITIFPDATISSNDFAYLTEVARLIIIFLAKYMQYIESITVSFTGKFSEIPYNVWVGDVK